MKCTNGLCAIALMAIALTVGGCTVNQSGNTVRHGGRTASSCLETRALEYACNSKTKEDGFVAKDGDKIADDKIKSNPQYLVDINAVTALANEIRTQCRPEEVPLVDAALQDCCRAISSGTEQERIVRFKKLHEFQYRITLRKAWQAALRAARNTFISP